MPQIWRALNKFRGSMKYTRIFERQLGCRQSPVASRQARISDNGFFIGCVIIVASNNFSGGGPSSIHTNFRSLPIYTCNIFSQHKEECRPPAILRRFGPMRMGATAIDRWTLRRLTASRYSAFSGMALMRLPVKRREGGVITVWKITPSRIFSRKHWK